MTLWYDTKAIHMTYGNYITQSQNSSSYYFRIIIPTEIRHLFKNKREIRRSLRTDSRKLATHKARFFWVQWQQLFKEVKNTLDTRQDDTPFHINVSTSLKDVLQNYEHPDGISEVVKERVSQEKNIRSANPDIHSFTRTQVEGNEQNGIIAPQDIDSYLDYRLKRNGLSDKTLKGYKAEFKLLLELLDNRPLDQRLADNIVNDLQKLPSNRSKGYYAKFTIKDLLQQAIPHDDLLSRATANKLITRWSSFSKWAIKREIVKDNYFEDLQPKDPVPENEKRFPFTREGISKIFNTPIFTNLEYKKPYQYWIPLIGLYTGMRINEIAQLNIEDVHDNYFDVNEDGSTKKLKNTASRRKVPIHNHLKDLGLFIYIEQLKKQGVSQLFPELENTKNGYGDIPSKWFGRLKTKLGFRKHKESFHSFRHSIIYFLENDHQIFDKRASRLVGHKIDNITQGLYGGDLDVRVVGEVLERLNFKEELAAVKTWA